MYFALWVTKLSNSRRPQQYHQLIQENSIHYNYQIDDENDITRSLELNGKDIGDERR
jgi:hypothetical protein